MTNEIASISCMAYYDLMNGSFCENSVFIRFGWRFLTPVSQLTSDIFVQNTGSESLVRDSFFEGFDLDIPKIAGGQANVYATIFQSRCLGR